MADSCVLFVHLLRCQDLNAQVPLGALSAGQTKKATIFYAVPWADERSVFLSEGSVRRSTTRSELARCPSQGSWPTSVSKVVGVGLQGLTTL